MKEQQENSTFTPFRKGSEVWLEGTHLNIAYPKTKLAPKRYGPFKILEVISDVNYRLKLPPKWQTHDVFHASLLTPAEKTWEYGIPFTRPPPEIVSGYEEFEVETIITQKLDKRRKDPFIWLIKWKDYPDADSSWESIKEIPNAMEALDEFYQRNPKIPRHPQYKNRGKSKDI